MRRHRWARLLSKPATSVLIAYRGLLASVVLGLAALPPAHALNPAAALTQYAHTAWRLQNGDFTGIPNVITQTKDGYLWIGTNAGVVRFDGVRFTPIELPRGESFDFPKVLALLSGTDGSLWIGMSGELARLKGDQLTRHPSDGRANELLEDARGDVWFVRTGSNDGRGPLCRISRDSGLRCFGRTDGLAFPLSDTFIPADQNSFWIASAYGFNVVRWNEKSSQRYAFEGLGDAGGSSHINALAITGDGMLWAGTITAGPGLGLRRLVDGKFAEVVLPGLIGSLVNVVSLFVDREDSLWVATTNHGLYRIRDGKAEHFGAAEGLSSDGVTGLFEDREGNLWVSTTNGIDRFRDLRVLTFSSREGLSTNIADSIAIGPDDSVWISTLEALDRLGSAGVSSLRPQENASGKRFSAVFVDKSGRVWAGVDDGLAVQQGSHFKRIPTADGKPLGLVLAIRQDVSGDIWALTSGPHSRLVRVEGQHIVEDFRGQGQSLGYSLLAAAGGGVWLSRTPHVLARFRNGQIEEFPYPRGKANSFIYGLHDGTDGAILGSTNGGLVVWREGQTRLLTEADGLPCNSAPGIAVDQQKTLWLLASCGLLRIEAKELKAWWNSPGYKIHATLYDATDGARAGRAYFGTSGQVTADGRVWFVNGTQLQMIDPRRLQDNKVKPKVHVESVMVDHQRYPRSSALRLPPNPRELQIDYTATSFVAPDKVRFRYKLEGHDDAWQEPGARRQAFYSDLKPGHYRFHVIACNNDGLWNEEGAVAEFIIPPTFVQTRWFIVLCSLGVCSIVWLVFRLRLRQLTSRIRLRLEARASERERIAGELHDTLMQSVLGLMMIFHAEVERLAPDDPKRAALGKVVERANTVVSEGRDRIQDLRSVATAPAELLRALAAMGDDLAAHEGAPTFRAYTTGSVRPLLTEVTEELRLLGSEALFNAFRHAKAQAVVVELEFGRRALTLSVRDDGIGLQGETQARGSVPGHWGLVGMRERAQRMGGRFEALSGPQGGTQVRVTIRASCAYVPRNWRFRWLWPRPIKRLFKSA
jgi:signal transduction histidine kinase/ligand-binding sensor domain-containing protein